MSGTEPEPTTRRDDGAPSPADPPHISVITICRNALPDLPETVESVLAQGYPRLEYWIVDGASTDGTPAYLATLTARGVRFLSEPDCGISDAMNKGARLATGELVAYLHTGDRYLPRALDAVARAYRSEPADVLCGAMRKREGGGEVVYYAAPDRLPYDMTIHHPATFTRRERFERHGGFDGTLRNAMDYEFFLRLWVAGARFRALPEPLVAVSAGGQSDRSLWRTLRETHAARRRLLPSGFQRSGAYLLALYARGVGRRALQRAGLGGLAARLRRRFALAPKG